MSFGPLYTFNRTANGGVPAPGGSGTTRYLREDATWDTPAGGTTPTLADVLAAGNSAGGRGIENLNFLEFSSGGIVNDDGSGGMRFYGAGVNAGINLSTNGQVDFDRDVSIGPSYDFRYNGPSDTNWRTGIINAVTPLTVGATTSLQTVFGAGDDGPDGAVWGNANAQSLLELRGYDGLMTVGAGIGSGTNPLQMYSDGTNGGNVTNVYALGGPNVGGMNIYTNGSGQTGGINLFNETSFNGVPVNLATGTGAGGGAFNLDGGTLYLTNGTSNPVWQINTSGAAGGEVDAFNFANGDINAAISIIPAYPVLQMNMQGSILAMGSGVGTGGLSLNLDGGTLFAKATGYGAASIAHDNDLGWNIADDIGGVVQIDSDNNGLWLGAGSIAMPIVMGPSTDSGGSNLYMSGGGIYYVAEMMFSDSTVQSTAYTGVPALQSVTDAGSVTTDAVTVGTLTVSGDLFESGYSTTAPTLPADSMYGFWFDEGANNFKITVKKSTGTVETGSVPCSSGGTQSANTFFAGPAASPSATPTFRTIASADVPTLNQNTTGTAANITAASNATLTTLSALTTGPNSMLFVGQYPTTIAYASSITPAATTNTNTQVVNVGALTANITINAPTGTFFDGQNIRFRFSQNSTGGYTITWNAAYVFGTDVTTSIIPTAANSKWEMLFTYVSANSNWRATAIVRGF